MSHAGGVGEPAASMVDVVFPLEGRTLPRDHRLALAEALARVVPWLRDAPGAGLHPVNLVHGGGEPALLSQRARVVLRVPRERAGGLAALGGRELSVAGHAVRLGEPHLKELLAHGTLFAHFVAAGDADEAAFLAAVGRELSALGATCGSVCGRRQRIRVLPESAAAGGATLDGFSLMLHGLLPAQARSVLEAGIGAYRWLGCGLFVPHRSAAAVGA